jgi:hypothetical protein
MNTIDTQIKILLSGVNWEEPETHKELGYIYFGPLMYNFFIWLKSEVASHDLVLFNSREGYFFKEIYELFQKKYELPKSIYFKTSRKLSSMVSYKRPNDIYESFKYHRYNGSLSNLLKDRFGVVTNVDDNCYVDSVKQIPDLTPYLAQILSKAKTTRDEYSKYINTIIGNSKNVIMVDSGFQGTTQKNIEKTYDLKFAGRYLIYKENPKLLNVKGLYEYENCKLKNNLIFFESVFIDKVGTYIDIINGEFVNEDISENQKYFNSKEDIISGIKKFVSDMLENTISTDKIPTDLSDNIFNLMCKRNYIRNAALFDIFLHDNRYTREYTKKLDRI